MTKLVTPTPGRVVLLVLSKEDCDNIDNERKVVAGRHCNPVRVGDIFPAIIVKAWPVSIPTSESPLEPGDAGVVAVVPESRCNLQVFIDGNFTMWATSRQQEALEDGRVPTPGMFHFPVVPAPRPVEIDYEKLADVLELRSAPLLAPASVKKTLETGDVGGMVAHVNKPPR
ncbi:MAG: hypothetical protein SFW67_28415 [Myxococcaceae bacterium]|nr:hypothetical protein [Myxococcaceae bacterium]